MFKHRKTIALLGAAAAAAVVGTRRTGRKREVPVAYTPVDTLKPVAENVWVVDSGPIRSMGLTLPIRMTAVRLGSGEVLLHSPTRRTQALAEQIDQLGPVRHLVAPSIGHWQFLREWQRACPAAISWGVPGLSSRRQVRASGTRIDRELGGAAPAEWSREIEHGLIGDTIFREAFLFHKPSRTLVLTDFIDNLETARLPAISRAVMRIARATSGTTPLYIRAALLPDWARMQDTARHLLTLEPERVIFAHGNWFESDGTARLREALRWT